MVALMEDEAFFDAVSNTLPSALSAHAQLEQMLSANLALARSSPPLSASIAQLTSEIRNREKRISATGVGFASRRDGSALHAR